MPYFIKHIKLLRFIDYNFKAQKVQAILLNTPLYGNIDVGTGSGILSIVSAKLGASHVTAVDYDETAIKVARENIAQYKVDAVISTGVSDLLKAVDTKADLIIANIVADIIIRLFDEVEDHWKPQGKLLCSGIIADRMADVTEAALAHGFEVEKVMEEKGWAAMVITRKTA